MVSKKTVRLQGVEPGVTTNGLLEIALELCPKTPSRIGRRTRDYTVAELILGKSLATDNGHQTATITYASDEQKEIAVNAKHFASCNVDDKFDGITLLYGGNGGRIDVDICAVHGLDGHAFDTWMADSKMWLRDHLPSRFPSCRIMTFGYNAASRDSRGMGDRLQDFADDLLNSLGDARLSEEERTRPVLFICHSLGGLVARLAMTRYSKYHTLDKYGSLILGKCGLLFLSSPHAGTMQADYSDLMFGFANLVGVRSNLVKELKVFNPALVDCMDDWKTIQPPPIFRCLCESKTTSTKVGERQIVDQVSAGFMGQTAEKIPETDHHTVCKFESIHSQGWKSVSRNLSLLVQELARQAPNVIEPQPNLPNGHVIGRPPISAPSFPPCDNHYFYNEISPQRTCRFQGRTDLVQDITTSLLEDKDKPSRIALGGMAGAGKTELLLQIAKNCRSYRSVFILPASCQADLEDAALIMAGQVGHNALQGLGLNYSELNRIWNGYSPTMQRRQFWNWVTSDRIKCIIMLDDLVEPLLSEAFVSRVVVENAKTLLSTRDPTLGGVSFDVPVTIVSPLQMEDILALLKREVFGDGQVGSSREQEQLGQLASHLERHVFATCAASNYLDNLCHEQPMLPFADVIQTFVRQLEEPNREARAKFLTHKFQQLSIMKLFESSLNRLNLLLGHEELSSQSFMSLLELMVFLEPAPFHPNPQGDLNIYDFFSRLDPWCKEVAEQYYLNDIFIKRLDGKGPILKAFRRTSIGITCPGSRMVQIPALWRECIMQKCNREVYWLHQILLLCFHGHNAGQKSMTQYAENCLRVAKRFGISRQHLVSHSVGQEDWLDNILSIYVERTV